MILGKQANHHYYKLLDYGFMSKREKRLQRLRQNPNNVSFEELRQVLEDHGFVLERSSGSHRIFQLRVGDETILFVVPYRKPIKPIYVKDAVGLIDEIRKHKPFEEVEDEQQNDE